MRFREKRMKIRTLICATLALTLLGSSTGFAQWDEDRDQNRHFEHHQDQAHHWGKGDRLPDQYNDRRYEVTDWRARHYDAPPRGYHYVRTDDGDIVLAAIAGGVIANILVNH